jgi:D-citramalate synthase
MKKHLEILDTTLRDGEQTPGVSFKPVEKKQIASILLGEVGIDRIEVGSARVSEGESEGVRKILKWAAQKNLEEKVEILGFVDKGKSVDWIKNVGGKVINLLTKGSERHCRGQLRKEPEQHFEEVGKEIDYAVEQGLKVNIYLEDWSNGMADSFPYVYHMVSEISKHKIERIMLADTLGISNPDSLKRYLEWMLSSFPKLRFDFHGHNDYGLVTANSLMAVICGVGGVHSTVNGLGERAGNQPLSEIVACIKDMTDRHIQVKENRLDYISQIVQTISGKRLAANSPIVGADVYTQTCGVHADGDIKGDLYANPLLPERFSRKRKYALGKLSGKASIDKNLEAMGMELSREMRDKVLAEVIRLGDKKKKLTPEDLPFIIADVLKTPQSHVLEIVDYQINSGKDRTPSAKVSLLYNNQELNAEANGDGGYDAFVQALRLALKTVNVNFPKLLDYEVRIPPGGKTDALVETTITWDNGKNIPMVTIGVDSDQTTAAIEATEKMLNIVLAQN